MFLANRKWLILGVIHTWWFVNWGVPSFGPTVFKSALLICREHVGKNQRVKKANCLSSTSAQKENTSVLLTKISHLVPLKCRGVWEVYSLLSLTLFDGKRIMNFDELLVLFAILPWHKGYCHWKIYTRYMYSFIQY